MHAGAWATLLAAATVAVGSPTPTPPTPTADDDTVGGPLHLPIRSVQLNPGEPGRRNLFGELAHVKRKHLANLAVEEREVVKREFPELDDDRLEKRGDAAAVE